MSEYYRQMNELGCAVLIVVTLVLLAAVYIRSRLQDEARAHELKRERADKVVEILKLLRNTASIQRPKVLEALAANFSIGPVGHHPVLDGSERWFELHATILTSLLADSEGTRVAEQFFEFFSFPAGKQQQVLIWFNDLLQGDHVTVSASVLQRIAVRILITGGPAEAEWLYRRSLEALRHRPSDPAFKAFVLHIGRLSYAFSRPGRRPTVYDEQAIANDIAMAT